MFMRCFVLWFAWSLCSHAFAADLSYYHDTDKIYSEDRGGSFTLFVSSDGMLYHKLSADVSALDDFDEFKVLGKNDKEIGRGECESHDFHVIDDLYSEDILICEMSFVDKHGRKINLTKTYDDDYRTLLLVDVAIFSPTGQLLLHDNWIQTDDFVDYYDECFLEGDVMEPRCEEYEEECSARDIRDGNCERCYEDDEDCT